MPEPRIRVALVVREGDRILLLRQEKEGRSYWLLPGGGLNWGETISEALNRELREELAVGLAGIGELLWCSETIAPDGTRHLVHLCFEGRIEGTPVPVAGEGITGARFFSPPELRTLDIRPPLGGLLAGFAVTGNSGPVHLGPLWTD